VRSHSVALRGANGTTIGTARVAQQSPFSPVHLSCWINDTSACDVFGSPDLISVSVVPYGIDRLSLDPIEMRVFQVLRAAGLDEEQTVRAITRLTSAGVRFRDDR